MKIKLSLVFIGLFTGVLSTVAVLFLLSFIQAKENALIMKGADLAIQQVITTVQKDGSISFQNTDAKGNKTLIKLILETPKQ